MADYFWKTAFFGEADLVWDAHPALADALAKNRPLPAEILEGGRPLAEARVEGAGKMALEAGEVRLTLAAGVHPSARLDLIRAGESPEVFKLLGLDEPLKEGEVGMLASFAGRLEGDFSARYTLRDGPAPRPAPKRRLGPASFPGSAGLSGEAVLRVFRRFPQSLGAAELLRALLREVRLPHAAAAPGAFPAPDTRLHLSREGALRLSAGAALPWKMNCDLPLPEPVGRFVPAPLRFTFPGSLRVRGHLDLDTAFSLLVAPVGPEGARKLGVRLSRSRDLEAGLLAVLGGELGLSADGPTPPLEAAVGALLGVDPNSFLSALRRLAAAEAEGEGGPASLADFLAETALGRVLGRLRDHLLPEVAREAVARSCRRVLGLDEAVQRWLFRRAGGLREALEGLRAGVDAGRAASLAAALVDAAGPGEFPFEQLAERAAWLDRWAGDLDALLEPGGIPVLEAVLEETLGAVRARSVLETLARLDTADEVQIAADEGLRRLAAAVLERPLSALPENLSNKVGQMARSLVAGLDALNAAYMGALAKVFEKRWRLEASLEYLRRKSDDVLLEAELDPLAADSDSALRALAGGDTSLFFADPPRSGLRLLRASLIHTLRRSLAFHLTLGPFRWAAVETLVTRQALHLVPDGEAWGFTLSLSAQGEVKRGWRDGEKEESDFRLNILARRKTSAPSPAPETWKPSFQAEYRLSAEDPLLRADELEDFLALAGATGALGARTPRVAAREVMANAPPGTAASLVYSVRVAGEWFENLLNRTDAGDQAERAILEILGWCWLRCGKPADHLRLLGGALQVASNRERFLRLGRLGGGALARLGPAQGKTRVYFTPLGPTDTAVLEATYRLAREGGEAFDRLRLSRAPGEGKAEYAAEALAEFSEKLAGLHNTLARWGGRLDTLPHVLLHLARTGGPRDAFRGGALEITLTPPNAPPYAVVLAP